MNTMKRTFSGIILAGFVASMTLVSVDTSPAQAGCLVGAVAGGLAGHFLGGHGLAGAAAGCAGGALLKHHQDNVQQRQQLQMQQQQQYNGYRPQYDQYGHPLYNR